MDTQSKNTKTLGTAVRSLREISEEEAKFVQYALKNMKDNIIDPKYILALTKSFLDNGERSLSDYIKMNTEILLNENSSAIRQNFIEKKKNEIQELSLELLQDAKRLDSGISNFLTLVQTNYESASKSFYRIFALTQEIHEKENLIKEKRNELFLLQNEIDKLEACLLDCLMCFAFISEITPYEEDKNFEILTNFLPCFGPRMNEDPSKLTKREVVESAIAGKFPVDVKIGIETADEIMKTIDYLKESNFLIVQNSHLNQKTLTHEKDELSEVKKDMNEDLKQWDEKIYSIKEEIEKAKIKQDKMAKHLSSIKDKYLMEEKVRKENELKKCAELYNFCTNSDGENIDFHLMKASIDNCIDDIFHELNKYPKKRVKELFKALDTTKKLTERKAEETLRAERIRRKLHGSYKLPKNKA